MKFKLSYILLLCSLALNVFSQNIFDLARNGDLATIEALIKINPDTINKKNENGFTPLIIAAYRNQISVVKLLLQHHVDVNFNSPEGTAILGACYKGNTDLVKLLIEYGANVNAQNQQGTSTLMFAILANNIFLTKLLLEHHVDKNLQDKNGKTCLNYAQETANKEILLLLQ